jgi:hypothetical protein
MPPAEARTNSAVAPSAALVAAKRLSIAASLR